MLHIDGFSEESLDVVNQMLFAQGWVNPYAGQCGQKQLREQNKQPRTPAQAAADKARGAARRGRKATGDRHAAAIKAAQTRKMCKG